MRCAIFLSLLLLVSVVLANDVDVSLPLEQSVNFGEWTSRGTLRLVVNKQEKKVSVKLSEPQWTVQGSQLAEEGSLVRVRMPAVDSDGQQGHWLMTSVPGCALLNDPKELFHLTTDKQGQIVALQYERPQGCGTKRGGGEVQVVSKVVAVLPKEVASPPAPQMTLDHIPVSKPGEESTEQEQAPQSFLQQYWHILLPAFLVYTLLTAQVPEEGGAKQAKKKD